MVSNSWEASIFCLTASRRFARSTTAGASHVFCEKPLATDGMLAMEMTAAMEKSGKVGMVNFTYRNSPALQRGREMVLAGEVGAVRHVEASHLQSWLVGN